MFYIRVLFALKLPVLPKAVKIAHFRNQEGKYFVDFSGEISLPLKHIFFQKTIIKSITRHSILVQQFVLHVTFLKFSLYGNNYS